MIGYTYYSDGEVVGDRDWAKKPAYADGKKVDHDLFPFEYSMDGFKLPEKQESPRVISDITLAGHRARFLAERLAAYGHISILTNDIPWQPTEMDRFVLGWYKEADASINPDVVDSNGNSDYWLQRCNNEGIQATFLDNGEWSVREQATTLAAVVAPTLKEAYLEYVRRRDDE